MLDIGRTIRRIRILSSASILIETELFWCFETRELEFDTLKPDKCKNRSGNCDNIWS
jgi:hypothetical protein